MAVSYHLLNYPASLSLLHQPMSKSQEGEQRAGGRSLSNSTACAGNDAVL